MVIAMGQKLFIPITDELLYKYPELITSPLRPYQIDRPCFHWMATIEPVEKEDRNPAEIKRFDHTMNLENEVPSTVQQVRQPNRQVVRMVA